MIDKGDIVTVVALTGEFVGRVKEQTDQYITLEHPRMFVQTEQGAGFGPGVSITGTSGDDLKEASFNLNCVLTVIRSDDGAASAWVQSTSGLILK